MVTLAKPLIDLPALEPQGKSNEWYTPARYIEAARRVMGGIDLDPASCEMANRTVKATRYYTAEDNGLEQVWHADSVWLNPPYGKIHGNISLMKLFLDKLMREMHIGNVKQAIVLTTCDTDERWFIPLWNGLICFADHPIWFHRPDGLPNSKQFLGSIAAYLGPNEQAFIDVFGEFGPVAKRVSTPRTKPAPLSLWEVSNV